MSNECSEVLIDLLNFEVKNLYFHKQTNIKAEFITAISRWHFWIKGLFIHSYPFRSRYFALIILLFLSLWNWWYPDWHDQDVYIKGTLDLRFCISSLFLWNCNRAENSFCEFLCLFKASNIKKMLKDWLLRFFCLLSISPIFFCKLRKTMLESWSFYDKSAQLHIKRVQCVKCPTVLDFYW